MLGKLGWLLFGLAFLAAVGLAMLLLNASVALDNARSETARQQMRSDLALSVIRKEWLGREVTRVTRLSAELEKQGVIVGAENDDFEIGDLVFESKNGLVTDVHYID